MLADTDKSETWFGHVVGAERRAFFDIYRSCGWSLKRYGGESRVFRPNLDNIVSDDIRDAKTQMRPTQRDTGSPTVGDDDCIQWRELHLSSSKANDETSVFDN